MHLIVQHPALPATSITAFEQLAGKSADLTTDQLARWEHCDANADEIAQAAATHQVDAALVKPDMQLTDFRLIVFDMDSTLITAECIDEIADFAGQKEAVAAITEAAMRGELDFSGSLNRRLSLLTGLDEAVLNEVYEQRVTISPGAPELLSAAHTAGLQSLLVSGGFTWFTQRIATKLNINHNRANTLEIVDAKLTGKVIGEIVDADVKRREVVATCESIGCAPSQAIVIGDGANDLAMMTIAGMSVAYRAKPAVVARADHSLRVSPLNAVLNWFNPAQ
jgi:phosphoserine phosphatase